MPQRVPVYVDGSMCNGWAVKRSLRGAWVVPYSPCQSLAGERDARRNPTPLIKYAHLWKRT
eukprot:77239-Chlamydomonas_euryale.AAC.4